MATGLVASAQVGIGNTDPKVSLQVDRSTDNAQADGVLVTRVTVAELNAKAAAYGTDQNSALVYITAIAGATGQTSNVTATGFHYFDSVSNKWVALKGAAGANIYSNNGTLTGARTVDQNNNNLTFATGTARAIVNGTFQMAGGLFAVSRTVADNPLTVASYLPTDYVIIMTGAATGQFVLPNATDFPGRVLIIHNATGGLRTFNTSSTPAGINYPLGNNSIAGGRSTSVISDGSVWRSLN